MGRKKAEYVVKVQFPTFPQAALKLGVDKRGKVQRKVTKEVMKNLPDFMPRESGELIEGMGMVTWSKIRVTSPYARFLFFGKTDKGKAVKYSRERNPNAGPHWDRRMVAARGKAIMAKIRRYC